MFGLFSRKTRRSAVHKSPTFRPQLEVLEDRTVPTALYWNPSSGVTNWSDPNSGWHETSDFGIQHGVAPNSGDTCTFDNTKPCTLNVSPTIGGLTISAATTISINGRSLSTAAFSMSTGTIDFGGGAGSLVLDGGTADTISGTVSFLGANGVVSTEHGETLSIAGGSNVTLQSTLIVGDAGSQPTSLLKIADAGQFVTGSIDLGSTGDVTVNPCGMLNFLQEGTFYLTAASTNTNTLTNYNAIGSYGAVGDTTIDIPVLNVASASQLTASNRHGTLQINDAHGHASSVTQSAGNTTVYTGCTFSCPDGYNQSGGSFYIKYDVTQDTTAITDGDFHFTGGEVRINSSGSSTDCTWNAGSLLGDITLGSTVDLYMHAGKSPMETDQIVCHNIDLGGTLHVAINGVFNPTDSVQLINAAGTIGFDFTTKYLGWTGTVLLSTQYDTVEANGYYWLVKK